MGTQEKDFSLKITDFHIKIYLKDVDTVLANTKSEIYKDKFKITFVIQNNSPNEIKLNKITEYGFEETSNITASSNTVTKVDTYPGQHFTIYYSNTKIGIMKTEMFNNFGRRFKSNVGEKMIIKLVIIEKRIMWLAFEDEDITNGYKNSCYIYLTKGDYNDYIIDGLEFYPSATHDYSTFLSTNTFIAIRGRQNNA